MLQLSVKLAVDLGSYILHSYPFPVHVATPPQYRPFLFSSSFDFVSFTFARTICVAMGLRLSIRAGSLPNGGRLKTEYISGQKFSSDP